MKKKKNKLSFNLLLFILGVALCSYPLIHGIYENYNQRKLISSYETSIKKESKTNIDDELNKARKYNAMLYQTNGAIVRNSEDILSDDSYQNILNMTGTGIMGSIQIPSISVDLPIYHGVDDVELSKGVGHLPFSSLPVGGKSTRALLSAHRGLPTSKLFTRLDEVKEGDYFFISICNQKLAYQVNKIEKIKPEEIDKLDIVPNEDLVSLITCTPYGINTHRLIVTGKRVPYIKNKEQKIMPKMMSWRELIFSILPFVLITIYLYPKFKKKLKERKEKASEKD